MAKNTSSSAFRKIDVDEYNEDNYKEEDASEVQSPVAPDENEITQLLNQGKNVDALKSCLRSAPLGSKNQKIKVELKLISSPLPLLSRPNPKGFLIFVLFSFPIRIVPWK